MRAHPVLALRVKMQKRDQWRPEKRRERARQALPTDRSIMLPQPTGAKTPADNPRAYNQ